MMLARNSLLTTIYYFQWFKDFNNTSSLEKESCLSEDAVSVLKQLFLYATLTSHPAISEPVDSILFKSDS